MKVRYLVLFSIVSCFSLIVMGCPTPVTPPPDGSGTTNAQAAEKLADEAIGLMKAQDWDGALSKFSEAVAKDSSNGRAVLGYSALNIASITSDSSVVSMAKNKLGFANYPSTMNQVLVPSNWMVTLESGGMMPVISGESAYDGVMESKADGIIDQNEKMFAFAAWFATHNTGFNELATTVGTALGTRLDLAVSAVKAVSDSAQLTLTWDMFSTTQPAEGNWWPYNASHQPMSIVIGKAELLAIASTMEMVRGFTYLAQVYDLSLPFGEYWASYNPNDGTQADPTHKPFATFLQLNTDAAAQLAGAKSSYTSAMDDFSSAADMVLANRAGYFVSSDASTGAFTDSTSWNDFARGIRLAQKAANVTGTSIKTSVPAVFPISFKDLTAETWPTTVVAGQTVGVNYGVYFNSPIGLMGTLFELSDGSTPSGEASGEPIYYSYASGSFTQVTSSYFSGINFQSNGETLYVRIPDATFGGVLDLASIPMDNPSTQTTFTMGFYDSNINGLWDQGETINWAEFYPQVEGLVNPSSGYGGDPVAFYSTEGTIPDALLQTYTTDVAGLRTALGTVSVYCGTATIIMRVGNAVYLPTAPNYICWNSFAAKGATATGPDGETMMTSTGSIWLVLPSMFMK